MVLVCLFVFDNIIVNCHVLSIAWCIVHIHTDIHIH